MTNGPQDVQDITAIETQEWLDSLEWVLQHGGPERVAQLLDASSRARHEGVPLPFAATTPYVNTIGPGQQPPFPGNREIERRIKSLVRWNAMAMVVRRQQEHDGIGGHISTFASAATLYEVGFNHFFRGPRPAGRRRPGLLPGPRLARHLRAGLPRRPARAKQQLENFRRSWPRAAACPRYPHPWLMPDFWQFPTVSMGLGPIMAIYQARFNRYLEDRGLKKATEQPRSGRSSATARCDEPEIARRDHARRPREARQPDLRRSTATCSGSTARCAATARSSRSSKARSAAPAGTSSRSSGAATGTTLLARDETGLLVKRMGGGRRRRVPEVRRSSRGAYIREHFFGKYPELLELVEAPVRRAAAEAAARRARPRKGLRRLQGGGRDTRARRRSSWPRRSRATASARRAKARNIDASAEEAERRRAARVPRRASASRSPTKTSPRRRSTSPADDSPEMKYLQRAAQGARRLPAAAPRRRRPRRSRRGLDDRSRSS